MAGEYRQGIPRLATEKTGLGWLGNAVAMTEADVWTMDVETRRDDMI